MSSRLQREHMHLIIGVNETKFAHINCINYLFLKRLGVLHNINIYFQPGDERRSCNVVETEYFVNCTVFVSFTHISNIYMRFHVYQHVTSFSHMRSALVGKRTTATGFHSQTCLGLGLGISC